MATDPMTQIAPLLDELAHLELTGANPHRSAELKERVLALFETHRQAMRFECTLPVQVRVDGRREAGVITNIGAGGLLVQTTAPAAQGVSVEVTVQGDVALAGASIKGSVVWAQPGVGLGVAYQPMDPATLERLQAHLVSLATQALPREI